jgi:ABC-type polar amino acid transport system ATPase subunit
MRELARLAIAMKNKIPSVDNLTKCIQPIMWTSLLDTIKDVAGFDAYTCSFRSPSYVEKVGNSLKKFAKMLRTPASEAEDNVQEERMKRFLKCYDDEYYER